MILEISDLRDKEFQVVIKMLTECGTGIVRILKKTENEITSHRAGEHSN